ncbi:hypothetical protein DCC85_05680 [Paenibacillus sp. CAA11]|uniref:hypothetical protein n=1 Tax=Paenibacillus sp. CAA11 TaxID=1532905 RepID=UPI000D394356|nr:hypothetical protein [Paenibacillus sp. CAA11]AWB43761.1 hypothetical protein DCC85_05680 [Paenibacillus sp. CAA11]
MKLKSGRSIKYILMALVVAALIILAIFLRNQSMIKQLPSTDLTSLSIEGIVPDRNIDEVDLTRFSKSSQFEDRVKKKLSYTYYEDFLLVTDRSGKIVQVQTLTDKGIASVLGGRLSTLTDVEHELGTHYIVKSYNREQGLNSRTYYDKQHGLRARFVYAKTGESPHKVIWLILEKY